MMRQGALWQDCGEVWLALETAIRLSGWTRDRCGGTPLRAIRTRAMLIAGVGRQVQSGGQRTVKVSILHEKSDVIAKGAAGSVENGHPGCQLGQNYYSTDENQPKLPPSAALSNSSQKALHKHTHFPF